MTSNYECSGIHLFDLLVVKTKILVNLEVLAKLNELSKVHGGKVLLDLIKRWGLSYKLMLFAVKVEDFLKVLGSSLVEGSITIEEGHGGSRIKLEARQYRHL